MKRALLSQKATKTATTRTDDTQDVIREALRIARQTTVETIAILEQRFPTSLLIERLRMYEERCAEVLSTLE